MPILYHGAPSELGNGDHLFEALGQGLLLRGLLLFLGGSSRPAATAFQYAVEAATTTTV